MLVTQSEVFLSPDKIYIYLNGKALARARECNIITTAQDNFICEYGENECFGTFLGSRKHYIEISCIEECSRANLAALTNADIKIRMADRVIIFNDCKVYKSKTKISGGKEVVTEICLVSSSKTTQGEDYFD